MCQNSLFLSWVFHSLLAYAKKIVGEEETAKDIVHDFFILFWEMREIKQITTSLKAYLYKSVKNNCLQYLEHKKVITKYNNNSNMHEYNNLTIKQDSNDPLSILINQEIACEIEKAIDYLPEKCKEILIMWHNEL